MDHARTGRIPGEPLLWWLFLGDVVAFSVLALGVVSERRQHAEMHATSSAALYQDIGLANTLTLLASSYLVVLGLTAVRMGRRGRAHGLFAAALCGGCLFAVVKVVEWALLIDGGHRASNQFFVYYFSLTGLHFLQVCIGLVVLAALMVGTRRGGRGALGWAESGCCYWHVVDVIWLVLFALFYLSG